MWLHSGEEYLNPGDSQPCPISEFPTRIIIETTSCTHRHTEGLMRVIRIDWSFGDREIACEPALLPVHDMHLLFHTWHQPGSLADSLGGNTSASATRFRVCNALI